MIGRAPSFVRDSWAATRALSLLLFLLALVVSCGADAPLGAPVAGQEPARSGAAMPAALKMAALRASQEAPGHDFEALPSGALHARIGTPGTEARVEVSADGAEIAPADGSARFAVRTVHAGRRSGGAIGPVESLRGEGQEAVLARGGIEERYLAGPRGLEQSFRVSTRPEGDGPLVIEVAFEGVAPEGVAGASDKVRLREESGAVRGSYRDLAAADAKGHELAARMEVSSGRVALVIDDAGAAYPVVVDPLIAQQAKLLASDPSDDGDWFGTSVSLSGDTAVIGAPFQSWGRGTAYVFVRNGVSWTQQAKLLASDGAINNKFGWSVSVSGDTAIVGAPGPRAAYVFVRNGVSWTQQAKLLPSDGVEGFGYSVAISVDTAVVGAYLPSSATGAYVFVRSGASWTQQAKLVPSDGIPGFGCSVGLSGDTTIVGTQGEGAYVFVRSFTSWTQQAKLVTVPGVGRFGAAVSISADTALVGAPDDAGGKGAAYVFARSGTSWGQPVMLLASDGAVSDSFGASVCVDIGTAIVGAYRTLNSPGAAYVFTRSGTSWPQQAELLPSDGETNDHFGWSVTVSGSTALVGAPAKSTVKDGDGATYVFAPPAPLGVPCEGSYACQSGFCVDGVCCNTACGSPCAVCTLALGSPADGTCGAAPDGSAPRAAGCGSSVCNGASQACPCTSDADCANGAYCDAAGACVPQKAQGVTCNPNPGADCKAASCSVCASGSCSDGVCCDQPCAGSCDVCSSALGATADGTCTPLAAGMTGSPPCASGALCDGTHGACLGGCATNTDCPPTKYCDTGTGDCKLKQADGDPCTTGAGCTSGYCFDSVCCNQYCGGQCQMCNSAQNKGSCVPILGDPTQAGHPACPGDGSSCQGTCDGAETATCHFPSAGTSCGNDASCSGDVSTSAQACDGAGLCAPAKTMNCPPYVCDSASGACKQSCATSADCAQGATCDTSTGKCATAAGTCEDAFTAKSPDGQLVPCSPYRCKNGACQATCASDADCADGSTCKGGKCEPGSGAGGSTDSTGAGGSTMADGGCGCRVGGGSGGSAGPLALLLPLLVAARRRRKA